MEKTDQQIVAESIAGNDDAFQVLVKRHLNSVYNYVLRISGNKEDAQDIVSDTFLKAWKHLKRYRPNERFAPWLFTIAHHSAIDILRKRRNIVFSDIGDSAKNIAFEETLADDTLNPSELAEIAEDADALRRAMNTLTPLERAVLHLRYYEELNFDEVGSALKEPLHTVKSRHRRALGKLRALLAPKRDIHS